GVAGTAARAGVVLDEHLADALRVPGQETVDECEVQRVEENTLEQLTTNDPERADAHARAKDEAIEAADQPGAEGPPGAVLLRLVAAIDEVELPRPDGFKELRDLFRGVLQVIVHGDDQGAARASKAAHDGVVLAVVAHELDGNDGFGVRCLQLGKD